MNWITPLDIGLVMGLLFAWAVVALALAFRLLDFPDLTIEGSLPVGAAVFASLYTDGVPMMVSVLCAMLVGGLAGALTGFLYVRFKLNKFLAGIIVVSICYSVSLRVMGGSNIGLLTLGTIFDVVEPMNSIRLHAGTVMLLTGFLLVGGAMIVRVLSMPVGIRLRAAGSNPEFARGLGINLPVHMVVGLFATNCLAALAGVLLAMHQGFADVGTGQGVLILALAAMTIGERLLPTKHLPLYLFVFLAAILGSVVYQILVAYAVRMGLAPTDLKLATAVLVLVVIALRVSRNGDLLEVRS